MLATTNERNIEIGGHAAENLARQPGTCRVATHAREFSRRRPRSRELAGRVCWVNSSFTTISSRARPAVTGGLSPAAGTEAFDGEQLDRSRRVARSRPIT